MVFSSKVLCETFPLVIPHDCYEGNAGLHRSEKSEGGQRYARHPPGAITPILAQHHVLPPTAFSARRPSALARSEPDSTNPSNKAQGQTARRFEFDEESRTSLNKVPAVSCQRGGLAPKGSRQPSLRAEPRAPTF